MRANDLQHRKMNLIEYLIGVQDEKLFAKIESSIQKDIESINPNKIAFSKQDLIARAQIAITQIEQGEVTAQTDLEQQSKNW